MRARTAFGPRVRRACMAALVSALGAAAAHAADPAPRAVLDPHYGDGLFHFYQDRYFTSVTTLMTSQHFGRMPNHADDAEVLRGGLLLSYGLHREAGEIFARLIESTTSASVRDRAWFYLAKIRYQRGFLAEAEDAVVRIGAQLPPELEEERGLLHANLLMRRGDYAGAAKRLGSLTGSAQAGLYARFNLGVALLRDGDAERGGKLLDEIGRIPTEANAALAAQGKTPALGTEEFQSLRDKANVALGFAALQDKTPDRARGFLERVRLEGAQSNKALLGFGWAADAMKDPKLALVPWSELAGRDASDPAVLEARIAVPYAYAELGAYGQALDRYNDALAAFDREDLALNDSIAAIRSGQVLEALAARNPGTEMGWFWALDQLPDLPHASHLAPVIATHEFQEGFKNYRDLQFLATNLSDWADKLGIFDDMLANRRQAFAERLPKTLAQAGASDLAALQKRAEGLGAEVDGAESDADGVALADAVQREQLARVARIDATLATAGDDAEMATARERARRVRGALAWQLAQEQPTRAWEARKSLAAIADGLADAGRRSAALEQAQRDEPAKFATFDERIRALGPRIQALIPRVAALQGEQRQALQEFAVAELTRQKARLAEYTLQARFAVAQLYDRASLLSNADHAPTKP